MILVIGEILFDQFPTYKRIGGAPFNFAFHMKALGFEVRFISRVGRDKAGKQLREFIEKNKFDPMDVQEDPDHPTGLVEVTMTDDGLHSFSILPGMAYDHIAFDSHLKTLCSQQVQLLYFGTLVQRTKAGADLIKRVIEHLPGTAIKFCDINLRPECYSYNSIKASLESAQILKLNHEELNIIIPGPGQGIKTKALNLMKTHSLELIILTRGEKPSFWFLPDICLEGPDPLVSQNKAMPADTVGAGDAYSAMAMAGRLSGQKEMDALIYAQEFAGRICAIQGALPDNESIYREFKPRLGKK